MDVTNRLTPTAVRRQVWGLTPKAVEPPDLSGDFTVLYTVEGESVSTELNPKSIKRKSK